MLERIRNLRRLAIIAILCLLWAQVAVAAYACPVLLQDLESAVAAAGSGGDAPPCSEHDASRPGLCLAHCNPGTLSLTQYQVDTPPAILLPLHPVLPAPVPAAQCAPAVPAAPAQHAASPPLSVLYCCFRT